MTSTGAAGDVVGRGNLRVLPAWVLGLVLGALLVVGVQRLAGGGAERGALSNLRPLALGKLCSVLLVNGQIYYGVVAEAGRDFIRLSDVYYVRSGAAGADGAAQNQLVSRRKTDFHAPEWMEIPVEKIVFIEKVGDDSTVARLMAQDHQTPGRGTSASH
jgi:hypothetical protein